MNGHFLIRIIVIALFGCNASALTPESTNTQPSDNKIQAASQTMNDKKPNKIKYKQGKNHNFDSQVVEGQIYRPDLSVVTGDTDMSNMGVLRLRYNFADHLSLEVGEEIK